MAPSASSARIHLETLLQAKKLDVTLTTSAARVLPEDRIAPTGIATLDASLGGGLRRGHLSEITGPRSSGRTTLLMHLCAAAIDRGEVVAVIDTHDRFDPAAAVAAGIDLARLLWVRLTGDANRAVKAMNLVLQAGGFGIVALDLSDAGIAARQFPFTTWMRLARIIEGSQTVALLVGSERLGRSPGGVTLALEAANPQWQGRSDRARLLSGVAAQPRIINRQSVNPQSAIDDRQ